VRGMAYQQRDAKNYAGQDPFLEDSVLRRNIQELLEVLLHSVHLRRHFCDLPVQRAHNQPRILHSKRWCPARTTSRCRILHLCVCEQRMRRASSVAILKEQCVLFSLFGLKCPRNNMKREGNWSIRSKRQKMADQRRGPKTNVNFSTSLAL
jgi:hypothetical protein